MPNTCIPEPYACLFIHLTINSVFILKQMKPGGKIPESFFLTDQDRYFQNDTQVKKIALANQKMKEINVDVEEAGVLLQWEFYVKNKDIGFGVSFKTTENEMQEVIPIQRYNTSDGTEKDSYKCQLPGTCEYKQPFSISINYF